MTSKSGHLEVKKGDTIIREGEPGKEMFVIEEGEVEILKGAPGSERRLGVLSQGDFFGEMSIIDDLPRGATARALTDCHLLAIDHSTFDLMLRQYPEVAIRMLRRMSARMREAERRADLAGVAAPPGSPELPPSSAEGSSRGSASSGADSASVEAKGWKLFAFESGVIVVLQDRPEIRIGRFDSVTGTRPDVDLTDLDTHRTTSRRHARIVREEGRVFVSEEIGTANGTFVNGNRIGAGVRVEVKDGDWLQFGDVKTIFKAG